MVFDFFSFKFYLFVFVFKHTERIDFGVEDFLNHPPFRSSVEVFNNNKINK